MRKVGRLGELLFNMKIPRYTSFKQDVFFLYDLVCFCWFKKRLPFFLKWNQF